MRLARLVIRIATCIANYPQSFSLTWLVALWRNSLSRSVTKASAESFATFQAGRC